MSCIRCHAENLTDYPVCRSCASEAHFTARADCRCAQCAAEQDDASEIDFLLAMGATAMGATAMGATATVERAVGVSSGWTL